MGRFKHFVVIATVGLCLGATMTAFSASAGSARFHGCNHPGPEQASDRGKAMGNAKC